MKDTTDRLQYLLDRNITKKADTYVEWNDSNKTMAKIQSILTDMAFKKSQIEKEMETAQTKYLKKKSVALRRSFLERFHFPMQLARGEFICYHCGPREIKVFSYEGQPFAVEKQCINVSSDGNTFCGVVYSCTDTIFNDIPLRNIIKAYMELKI